MSKSGKEIVAEAARQAVGNNKLVPMAFASGSQRIIEREFAPFAELIEAAQD